MRNVAKWGTQNLPSSGPDDQDPEPGAAGHQLQAAEEGGQRGDQDLESRPGRVCHPGGGQRAPGDPAAHPPALRGQGRAGCCSIT